MPSGLNLPSSEIEPIVERKQKSNIKDNEAE